MWLSGNSTPNFRTINNFRSQKLKGQVQNLFAELVKILHESGSVSLKTQYIDGTKIEAAANRYSFVWRGSVEKYKEKLGDKIDSVLQEIECVISKDSENLNIETDYKTVDSDLPQKKINTLNEHLNQLNKKQQKQVKQLEKESLPRLRKYEKQLELLGNRNSYSKTDRMLLLCE